MLILTSEKNIFSHVQYICVSSAFFKKMESYSFKVDFQPTVQATDNLKYLKCRSCSTESLDTLQYKIICKNQNKSIHQKLIELLVEKNKEKLVTAKVTVKHLNFCLVVL